MQEMQENKGARKEGLRTGWIKERWESGHGMLYRWDAKQEGFKTGVIHKRRDLRLERYRKRGNQEKRDTGK